MKKWFLKKSLNLVKDYNPEFNDEKLDELRYGLEASYISITKTVVILFASFLLELLYESIVLLILFNVLRLTGFGLHAKKSWMCWISSSLTFIVIPWVCKSIIFPKLFLIIVSSICLICFILYAPADTEKRPLIHEDDRFKYKFLTIFAGLLYFVSLFLIDNQFMLNSITFAMIIESVLIHPLTYKIFNLPYNNYKTYVLAKNRKKEV